MKKMISVASDFQSSVNIAYDLNNDSKLLNYIPTKSALDLLEDILLSTKNDSNRRARLLIGAYGKGKSHIILMILGILMKKDRQLFDRLLTKTKKDNKKLYELIKSYYEDSKKILPVVIRGSNTSLSQSLLLSLQKTLEENELANFISETNYSAAVATIERWKSDFPDTYKEFFEMIDIPASEYISNLTRFDPVSYSVFESLYPKLTAGSTFNPFLGLDVIELYERVLKGIKKEGYSGIYIVYDEFSKYLENNLTTSSKQDSKLLQDLAEKCNRSSSEQLHLLLISHKEITSYISKASKKMVDSWRGVSERFIHVFLNNNFNQTYDIIGAAIQKESISWKKFCEIHEKEFTSIDKRYITHPIFSDVEDPRKNIRDCYPLHPISTFILPRLSERVAQNERTLFTFLSADGENSLKTFLKEHNEDEFKLVTPDKIFDYFESLIKQEIYSGSLHEYYVLTRHILNKLGISSLEEKVIKSLSLIYILEQFEKLRPTKDEIIGILSIDYKIEEIDTAINNLIEKEYVIYLKRSNDCLRLKESCGVNIKAEIENVVEKKAQKTLIRNILNRSNFDKYIYPTRYNDDKEMTRYFAFEFLNEEEISDDVDWKIKSESIKADGIIYGIIPKNNSDFSSLKNRITNMSVGAEKIIFVLPKNLSNIDTIVREYDAVLHLKEEAQNDPVLFEEYEVVYEDLKEVVSDYIDSFTHPERFMSVYIHQGKEKEILRKTDLTSLISDVCDKVFSNAPIIVNEIINKEHLTAAARKSRSKIIAGLLRSELEPNLGLSGTGQEVSIMRSSLILTGVLINDDNTTQICLEPKDMLLRNILSTICSRIMMAKGGNPVNLQEIYDLLELSEHRIGMRKGLILIYLAAVFHEYKNKVVIEDCAGQLPMTADTMLQIEAQPSNFTITYLDWNESKEKFIQSLEEIFDGFIIASEKNTNPYESIANAMYRWYRSLPKYSRELLISANGEELRKNDKNFIRLFKQNLSPHELVFEKIPQIFDHKTVEDAELIVSIHNSVNIFNNALKSEIVFINSLLKNIFSETNAKTPDLNVSLTSIIRDWCSKLDQEAFNQLFVDGTDEFLIQCRNITNDEDYFIEQIAIISTGLRIEDWNEKTRLLLLDNVKAFKCSAENFVLEERDENSELSTEYQITYLNNDGNKVIKRFSSVNESKSGKLLKNALKTDINEMGRSITEHETRQILAEILRELC